MHFTCKGLGVARLACVAAEEGTNEKKEWRDRASAVGVGRLVLRLSVEYASGTPADETDPARMAG